MIASATASTAAQPQGLVNLSTSGHDTPKGAPAPELLEIETGAARLTRMRRRIVRAATLHRNASHLEPCMVTLTYAPGHDWHPRHISDALKRVRYWMGRRGDRLRYVWCAELQKRGAIHYHVIAWMPRGARKRPPFWDRMGWWGHGMSNVEWAHNAVGYIVKYATKIDSKDRLPQGARMHGSGGFTKDERAEMKHHGLPGWLRAQTYVGQTVERIGSGLSRIGYACGLQRLVMTPWVKHSFSGGVIRLRPRQNTTVPAVLLEHLRQWSSHFPPGSNVNPRALASPSVA